MARPSFLAVRESRFGKGLFTTENVASNTILCTVTGPVLTFQQTLKLDERESHCLQISNDKYLLCDPPFLYSNHSCEPNCGLDAQLQLFALRDLKKGEELFWDYSTSMLERHWTMPCACGSTHCRKLITDFDLLSESLQAAYMEKGIVLPFIVAQLQTFSKAHVHRA
jgi:SET domain-containing protein